MLRKRCNIKWEEGTKVCKNFIHSFFLLFPYVKVVSLFQGWNNDHLSLKILGLTFFEKILNNNISPSSNLWVKIFEILYCQQKTYSTFLWWKNVSLIGNTIELQQDKRKDKLKAVRWRKNYWSMIRFSWQDRIECDSFVLHVISVLTLLFNQIKNINIER